MITIPPYKDPPHPPITWPDNPPKPVHPREAALDRIETLLLERITALLTPPKPEPADDLPLTAARRRLAHQLGVPSVCGRVTCRRSRACRGEPKTCLAVALPLVWPETIRKLRLRRRAQRRDRVR